MRTDSDYRYTVNHTVYGGNMSHDYRTGTPYSLPYRTVQYLYSMYVWNCVCRRTISTDHL